MPLFSFQERFVPFVRNKTKRQTIRKFRKFPVKVGQPVTLVTGSRFSPVEILTERPTIYAVDSIVIYPDGSLYIIPGHSLTEMQQISIKQIGIEVCPYPYVKFEGTDKDRFAWWDGFRHPEDPNDINGCFRLMLSWWRKTHELPFIGFVAKW